MVVVAGPGKETVSLSGRMVEIHRQHRETDKKRENLGRIRREREMCSGDQRSFSAMGLAWMWVERIFIS